MLFLISVFLLGAPISDSTYASPIVVVHVYRQGKHKTNKAEDQRTIVVDNKNEQKIHTGPKILEQKEGAVAELEIIVIPVEDIIHISAKATVERDVKGGIETELIPVYDQSENCCDRCYEGMKKCCGDIREALCCCCRKPVRIASEVNTTVFLMPDHNKNVQVYDKIEKIPKEKENCCTGCINKCRCWCCRIKKLRHNIRRTYVREERQAKRVITMTINYSKHSHPDTLSNARLLSAEDQNKFYKGVFVPHERLEFYLVNDTEFDRNNFETKMQQATNLCRTVMQMKAVNDRYPPSEKLFSILESSNSKIIGDQYKEPDLPLATQLSSLDRSALGTAVELKNTQWLAIEQRKQ